MMTVRHTTEGDIPRVMEIFHDAKEKMRADGNFQQWSGAYPDEAAVMRDIARGVSYVIEDGGEVVATFAFIPGADPTYSYIEGGEWLDDTLPYGTIHRIASAHGVHGAAAFCISWCFDKVPNLRIDTHRDNNIMQHVIARNGFVYCGIIYLADGAERLAYQKLK